MVCSSGPVRMAVRHAAERVSHASIALSVLVTLPSANTTKLVPRAALQHDTRNGRHGLAGPHLEIERDGVDLAKPACARGNLLDHRDLLLGGRRGVASAEPKL